MVDLGVRFVGVLLAKKKDASDAYIPLLGYLLGWQVSLVRPERSVISGVT